MILPLKIKKIKKVYKTKKSCIGTKYPPLSAKCSSLKMKNYHPGLTYSENSCIVSLNFQIFANAKKL